MRKVAVDLVGKLGLRLEIEFLELDDDNYCCVGFDDVVVNFEYEEEREEFLLFARVADAPGEPSRRYIEEVLDLSYGGMLTSGGCLGLDSPGGAVMFADRIPLRGLCEDSFEAAVKNFVDRAEEWGRLFAGPEFTRATAAGPNLGDMGEMMRI
ncbi:MAG TPA: type III secretion system chaperone [Beijerinckiaceae bacterium]|nr:type III secretion system chaperone [Beijerinckiaceae bacterium]